MNWQIYGGTHWFVCYSAGGPYYSQEPTGATTEWNNLVATGGVPALAVTR